MGARLSILIRATVARTIARQDGDIMRTDALVAAGSPNPGFRGIASRSPIRRLIAALNLCPFILTMLPLNHPVVLPVARLSKLQRKKRLTLQKHGGRNSEKFRPPHVLVLDLDSPIAECSENPAPRYRKIWSSAPLGRPTKRPASFPLSVLESERDAPKCARNDRLPIEIFFAISW
jgi:hypothetical protein